MTGNHAFHPRYLILAYHSTLAILGAVVNDK